MQQEPVLTAATVIHGVVNDLLSQNQFGFAHFPEVVDMAVVSTGLGALQSQLSFVKQASSYWDSTYWDVSPRPFLDTQSLAYVLAVTAWMRSDGDPAWANELPGDVKAPLKKTLKFLNKTDDSFFHPTTAGETLLEQSQSDWLRMAQSEFASKQVIAIRHFATDAVSTAGQELVDQQQNVLVEKLRSANRPIVLHAISSVESLRLTTEPIVDELRLHVESRDDETRAKAIIALTKLGQLDEATVKQATRMVDSSVKFIVYAGVFALSSQPTVTESTLRVAERGFVKAMQTCDYEFIRLFAEAFDHWLDDPQQHVQQLFQDHQPEYLEIAIEALRNVGQQSVALG